MTMSKALTFLRVSTMILFCIIVSSIPVLVMHVYSNTGAATPAEAVKHPAAEKEVYEDEFVRITLVKVEQGHVGWYQITEDLASGTRVLSLSAGSGLPAGSCVLPPLPKQLKAISNVENKP